MSILKKKFLKEAGNKMKEEFGYKNFLAIPKIEKISVNVGLSRATSSPNFTEEVLKDLAKITGQKPVKNKAKKAIAGFKIRAGQEVGASVTLRGERMWDFLDKLVWVSIPRIRDFQGISQRNIDEQGNLSLGFKEQTVFPEILVDEVAVNFGLQVNIKTTAKNKKEGLRLFQLLGFPFKQDF